MKKKLLGLCAVVVLVFVHVSFVRAADFVRPSDDDHGNLVLPTTDTYTNLYATGAAITLNSKVFGDLYAAGGNISLDGDVEEDIHVAGGTISVNAPVKGDLHAVGGDITVNGPVAGDVVVLAGALKIRESAVISGDVIIVGGNVVIDAPVAGSIKIAGGEVIVNNKVGKGIKAKIDGGLVFGPKADVAGTVEYSSAKLAVIRDGARVPQLVHRDVHIKSGVGAFFGILTFAVIIKLFAWIIAAWLVVHFWRRTSATMVADMQSEYWKKLLLGFAAMVAVPIICLILLVTGVGYYAAMILGAIYLLFGLFAGVGALLFVGRLAVMRLLKREGKLDWQTIVIGAVLLTVISFIPVVGWLAVVVVFCIAFGQLLTSAKGMIEY